MFSCSSVSTKEISSASFLEEEKGWKTLPPVLALTFCKWKLEHEHTTGTERHQNGCKIQAAFKNTEDLQYGDSNLLL